MNNSQLLLQLSAVTKNYLSPQGKKILIISKLDFFVFEQQTIAILGKSGSGKSTLLNIMAALDSVESGKILYQGKNLWEMPDKLLSQLRNCDFGFIFQNHYLLPELTALQNVQVPAMIRGVKNSKARAMQILERLGVDHRAEHRPSELSGGEAQRVAIARSLMNSPKILFADEPTGNLDEANALNIMQVLLELVSEFKTSLILVTHDQRIAKMMATRYTLNDGQLHEIS